MVGGSVDPLPGVYASLKAETWRSREGVKVLGDAEAREIHLEGRTSVKGRLTTGTLQVEGSLDVGGSITAEGAVVVRGDLRVGGAFSAGSVQLDGTLIIGSSATVRGDLRGSGRLAVTGDLQAGSVSWAGAVSVAGTVKGDRVELTVQKDSEAQAIEAGRVALRAGGSFFGRKPALAVLRIEANDAALDAVRCEYLRARRIALGAHAQVSRYDGEILKRHRGARVGPQSETPAPYGLSR